MFLKSAFVLVLSLSFAASAAERSGRECLKMDETEFQIVNTAVIRTAEALHRINDAVTEKEKVYLLKLNERLTGYINQYGGLSTEEGQAAMRERQAFFELLKQKLRDEGHLTRDSEVYEFNQKNWVKSAYPSLQWVSVFLSPWLTESGRFQAHGIVSRYLDLRTEDQKKLPDYINQLGFSDSLEVAVTPDNQVLVKYELSSYLRKPTSSFLDAQTARTGSVAFVKGDLNQLRCR
jgi:hypothetical protein